MIVAGVVALVITLVVIVFWIWSISGRFAESRAEVQDDIKPFGVLKDSVNDVFGSYKAQREHLKQERDEERALAEYLQAQQVETDSVSSELSEEYGFDISEDEILPEIIEVENTELDESEIVVDEELSSTE